MCDFISWIEKGDKVYFLTSKLIHDTPRGDIIQKRFPGTDELTGHAAIRAYFEIDDGGIERECTDFKSPKSFPPEIVAALKAGEFDTFSMPKELLYQRLYADYQAKRDALYADYKAKCDALYAWAWELFTHPENRVKAWR